MTRSLRRSLLLGAAVVAICWVTIAAGGTGYLTDYRLTTNPDARHYVELGENFWARGEYSRQDGPPFTPDVMRTPVYPLIAGALFHASGVVWPLFLFNAVCHLLTIAGVYRVGRLFGDRVASVASTVYALNPMPALLCFETMSEPLFTAIATWLTWLWLSRCQADRLSPRHAAGLGLMAGAAILTRPAGLYLPVIVVVATLLAGWIWRRRVRSALVWSVVFLLVTAAVITPWIVRNARVHQFPRLTNADTINLLYFSAAGCYAEERGITLQDAQAQLAERFAVPTLRETNNFWVVPGMRLADVDARQRAAAKVVVGERPIACARSTAKGIGKSLLSHNAGILAHAAGLSWTPPGLGSLLSGHVGTFIDKWWQNPVVLQLAFLLELTIAVLMLAAVPLAALTFRRDRTLRLPIACLVLVIGYHLLTIAVVGLDAYYRFRSTLEPVWFVLGALGLVTMTSWLGEKKRAARPLAAPPV